MTTHVGKIGRLPKDIRDELGQRIEDGEPGVEIVQWLNGLEEVKDTLQDYFQGRAITAQNLSDWRQAGHVQWLQRQERCRVAEGLTEQSDDLEEAADGKDLGDRLGTVLAAEMARLGLRLLEAEEDPQAKWKVLCEVRRELSALRRDDHRRERVAIRREQWERAVEREEEAKLEAWKARRREQLMAGLTMKPGDQRSEVMHRIRFDLPLGDLLKPEKKPVKEQKSRLIVPNRGKKSARPKVRGSKSSEDGRLNPKSEGKQEGEELNNNETTEQRLKGSLVEHNQSSMPMVAEETQGREAGATIDEGREHSTAERRSRINAQPSTFKEGNNEE